MLPNHADLGIASDTSATAQPWVNYAGAPCKDFGAGRSRSEFRARPGSADVH